MFELQTMNNQSLNILDLMIRIGETLMYFLKNIHIVKEKESTQYQNFCQIEIGAWKNYLSDLCGLNRDTLDHQVHRRQSRANIDRRQSCAYIDRRQSCAYIETD